MFVGVHLSVCISIIKISLKVSVFTVCSYSDLKKYLKKKGKREFMKICNVQFKRNHGLSAASLTAKVQQVFVLR